VRPARQESSSDRKKKKEEKKTRKKEKSKKEKAFKKNSVSRGPFTDPAGRSFSRTLSQVGKRSDP
jgi:hypothetical protein